MGMALVGNIAVLLLHCKNFNQATVPSIIFRKISCRIPVHLRKNDTCFRRCSKAYCCGAALLTPPACRSPPSRGVSSLTWPPFGAAIFLGDKGFGPTRRPPGGGRASSRSRQ